MLVGGVSCLASLTKSREACVTGTCASPIASEVLANPKTLSAAKLCVGELFPKLILGFQPLNFTRLYQHEEFIHLIYVRTIIKGVQLEVSSGTRSYWLHCLL